MVGLGAYIAVDACQGRGLVILRLDFDVNVAEYRIYVEKVAKDWEGRPISSAPCRETTRGFHMVP